MDEPTLDQLRVLRQVQRTGSVTAAAQALHRAQSAVSYAVRQLEAALGVPLLDRAHYRARLTDAGEAVLAQAEQVLTRMDGLRALAEDLRGGAEPRLSILMDGIVSPAYLMPVLAHLQQQGSATRINLRVELLGGMVRALRHDAPEVVLSPLQLLTLPPNYEWEVIGDLLMVPVVGATHPLARHPRPVPLDVVRQHTHLVVTSPPGEQVPVHLGLIGAAVHWSVPDFHTRLEGLRAGLGFAWMPTHLVEADVRAGTLVPLVLAQAHLQRYEVGLIYRAQPPLGRTGRLLLDELRHRARLVPRPPGNLLNLYELP